MHFRPLFFSLFAASALASCNWANAQDKTLTGLNKTRFEKAIEKEDFVPLDVVVTVRRDRPTFSLTIRKADQPAKWQVKFDLDDTEFNKLMNVNGKRKYRLKTHREYTVKGKELHLAIWHYDADYEPPKKKGTSAETKKPPAQPLPNIWVPAEVIPESGNPIPAFVPIDRLMKAFLKANQVPGVSIAITYQGKPVYARAFGYSDIETKTAMKPDQPMRRFELSRPITSAAILQLVAAKKIKLDTPVFEFIGVKAFVPKGKRAGGVNESLKKITVGHLLQDSGGFNPALTSDPFLQPRKIARTLGVEQPITHEHVISYMMSLPLDFEPGTEQAESNFGYMLLGRVIEKASGDSYEEYVTKNILNRLRVKR